MEKEREVGKFALDRGATINEVRVCPECGGKRKVNGKPCPVCFGEVLIPSDRPVIERKKIDRR